jgi:hypothetical protein
MTNNFSKTAKGQDSTVDQKTSAWKKTSRPKRFAVRPFRLAARIRRRHYFAVI